MQTKEIKKDFFIKNVPTPIFFKLFSGYDFCMITKRLHFAIKKEIKNNQFMISNIQKKSFFWGLKIKKKHFLLKVKNNSKLSGFII